MRSSALEEDKQQEALGLQLTGGKGALAGALVPRASGATNQMRGLIELPPYFDRLAHASRALSSTTGTTTTISYGNGDLFNKLTYTSPVATSTDYL